MLKSATMRANGLLFILSALLSVFVYARAFDNPFRQDDYHFLGRVETSSLADTLKPAAGLAFYRPGAVALFKLEHSWFGRNAGAYVAFNYTLHVLASMLMLVVLTRLGLHRSVALLASGLFLLGFGHYAKQVMWACSSGALAAAVLTLAAILVILPRRGSPAPAGGSRARILLSMLLLVMAAAFHEGSVASCVLVAFLVFTHAKNASVRRSALVFLALLPVLLAGWLLVSKWYSPYALVTGAGPPSSDRWIPTRTLEKSIVDVPLYLLRYLGFMWLPVQPTALDVARHPVVGVVTRLAGPIHVAVGAAMLAVIVGLAVRRRDAGRSLAVWLLLAILPFTLVQQPRHHLELRYLYNAAIPLCALFAAGVTAGFARAGRAGRIVVGALVFSAVAGTVVLELLLESSYDRWPSLVDSRDVFDHPAAGIDSARTELAGNTEREVD